MVEPVKRDYRSELRATQAADTRRSIVSTAARLFAEDGYGATTIDAVANAAGVSRKTVFTAVGGKVELLKTALDWAVAGDDAPQAISERPAIRELLAGGDPVELLAGWVRAIVEIDVRVAGLFAALEIAADADDEARRLLQEYQRQRLAGGQEVVRRLSQLDALGDGLSSAKAGDVAWLATDPVIFTRFVKDRGWSVKVFEAWLQRSLVAQLLACTSVPGSGVNPRPTRHVGYP
jgi:AcrR family transcriptional regulator